MEVDNELETELRQYPSNFDLYDEARLMPKEYVQKITGKLIKELDSNPYDTTMETLRAWNLISFLNFILGNENDAFEYNSKVVELSRENVIGLCNKAWFLLKMQEQYNVVKDLCKELKDRIRDKKNLLVAKAEKAFCYSRFGVKRYEKSRHLFEEVLEEYIQSIKCHQQDSHGSLETDDSKHMNIQADNFCVWNFGYALTFQRALNFNNAHDASSIDLSKQAIEKVCDLYCRIIHMKGESKCLLRYKARSYVELGLLVYNVRKNKARFPNGIKDILWNHKDLWMSTDQFYLKAIHLCPFDVFVLERSGRYFRYVYEIRKSKELLEKAIEIRGTAFSHHHLALTLKRKLESKRPSVSATASTPNSPVSREKQSASRNILYDFEKARCDFRLLKTEDNIHALSKHITPSSDVSNATNSKNHISEQREFQQKKANITHIQTPSSSDHFIQEKMLKSVGSIPNSSYSKPRVEIQKNVSNDKDVEETCNMLEHTSLDSGYESVPFASNVSMDDHGKETYLIPKQVNVLSKFQNENTIIKGETSRGLYNKNQSRFSRVRSSYKNYSSIRQNVPKHLYSGRNIDGSWSVERGRRRTNRYPPRRGYNMTRRTAVSERTTFVKMIKSPQKPPFIDKEKDAETIKQIMYHLDKSVELSNNCGAIYDKGLLYRQIGENDKALSTFKTLIRNEGEYCSLVQLSNAFEQSGLCLYEILSQSEDENKCKQDDMRTYFKKSIEISCSIVSKIPFLKDCWVSAPTLRCFLSGKGRTSEYLKDLVFLSKKFEDYGEVISVLKELKDLAVDEQERTNIDLQLIENYLSSESYDDAVLALDAICCLQNCYDIIDEDLYLRAHIDGGIHALKQEYFEMARLRLRNALDFYRHKQDENGDSENDTETEEETFDIFILCNEKTENKVKTLEEILKGFKLRVTINLLDLLPGASKMSGICQQFGRSKHFLLVIDDEPLSKIVEHYFEMMQEVVFKRNYGHIVIVKATHGAKVPLFISKYPNIEMNFETIDGIKEIYKNESLCKDVRTLLFKLASSKQTA